MRDKILQGENIMQLGNNIPIVQWIWYLSLVPCRAPHLYIGDFFCLCEICCYQISPNLLWGQAGDRYLLCMVSIFKYWFCITWNSSRRINLSRRINFLSIHQCTRKYKIFSSWWEKSNILFSLVLLIYTKRYCI